MKFLYLYIIIINFITYLVFVIDKKKARKNEWRIPEFRLLFLSFIGGSLGGILAMLNVKHKTKKLKFIIGMPLLLIINIIVIYYTMK